MDLNVYMNLISGKIGRIIVTNMDMLDLNLMINNIIVHRIRKTILSEDGRQSILLCLFYHLYIAIIVIYFTTSNAIRNS